jgi:hypothetical protein
MEEIINKMLGIMEYKDLIKLKKEVNSGGYLLQNLVNQKLNAVENEHRKVCASCGKELNLSIDDPYTLLFGEKTIRKKASFCGLDCLHEFLGILNMNKFKSLQKENLIKEVK